MRIRELGLRIQPGEDVEIAGFDDEALVGPAAEEYYQLGRRRGVERDFAAAEMHRNGTLIAAMLLRQGRVDGMLCGTFGAKGGVRPASRFRMLMRDPKSGREIRHAYATVALPEIA